MTLFNDPAGPAHAPPIVLLDEARFPAFAAYLHRHLADNGQPGHGHFQPIPAALSRFTPERAAAFAAGLAVPVGQPGWRRVWVAVDAAGAPVGHVDLRAHPEAWTAHRALLGLGVDTAWRRRGLARALCVHAIRWAAEDAGLAAIDLQVLGHNQAAISLYESLGFERVGVWEDFFRIDGLSLAFTDMSLRLGPR